MTTRAAHPATIDPTVTEEAAPEQDSGAAFGIAEAMSRCDLKADAKIARETGKDRCGVPATRRAQFASGHYLPVCTHHARTNRDALLASGATIQTIDGWDLPEGTEDFDRP